MTLISRRVRWRTADRRATRRTDHGARDLLAAPVALDAGSYAVVLMARGGAYAGAIAVSGGEQGDAIVELPAGTLAITDPARAILVDRVVASSAWSATWTAAGASNLPVDLLWIPL